MAPILIIGAVSCILAVASFLFIGSHFKTVERERFARGAGYAGTVFAGDLKRHVDSLAAFRAFVSASRAVTRWEFSAFASDTLPRNPGFDSVLWVPVVGEQDRAAYEAQLHKDGLYGLRIREVGPDGALEAAPQRALYYPVSYIEPFQEYASAVGIDLGVDPQFQPLFELARKSGRAVASPPFVRSLLDSKTDAGLVIAYPLVAQEAPGISGAQAQPLRGYALGVLALDRLLNAATAQAGIPLAAAIADDEPGAARRIFFSTDHSAGHGAGLQDWIREGRFGQTVPLTIGTRHFVLALRPEHVSFEHVLEPFGAGLVILLLGALLSQHFYTTAVARRRIELAVAARTAALNETNHKLEEEITQRREAEEDLRRARDKAESASRAKSEFLATMSHELRTPLNAIIGFSSLLSTAGRTSTEDQADFVKQIHEGGIRLLALINELLELSQMDAGRIQIEEEEIDLSDLASAAIEKLRPLAGVGEVELQTDVPARLPHLIADERRLQKAITNLLSNAIKFTPAGGFAAISIRREPDQGLSICVADSGVGIPEAQKARVLEPFVQLDSKLCRARDGAGLGLAYVKRIADLHGAELSIASNGGVGTRVKLKFPAARVARKNAVA